MHAQVQKGETVVKIGFGEWADMLIVVRKSDQDAITKVDEILNSAVLDALTDAPTPRQLVAVKTSAVKTDGAFHRAVVRAVNEKEAKARVRYGVQSTDTLCYKFQLLPD